MVSGSSREKPTSARPTGLVVVLMSRKGMGAFFVGVGGETPRRPELQRKGVARKKGCNVKKLMLSPPHSNMSTFFKERDPNTLCSQEI